METRTVQVRARGTLTLPAKVRERYGIDEGDSLSLVDLDGVLLLVPRVLLADKLGAEIERLAETAGISEDDLSRGVGEERRRYYTERRGRKP
jgi:AbrB family looped-hinge helix DNA binding protein